MDEDNFDDGFDGSLPSDPRHPTARRFRGYLPIAVDIETDGLSSATDTLPEIATTTVGIGEKNFLLPGHAYFFRIEPFEGADIEPAALELTGIKPDHSLRMTVQEEAALTEIFRGIRRALKANGYKRAILVGHNSSLDLGFLNVVVARTGIKHNPSHPFSNFNIVTLAGLTYDQTVLTKAYQAADMEFDDREAHSARYDAEKTTELFCDTVNRRREMGGWMDDDG